MKSIFISLGLLTSSADIADMKVDHYGFVKASLMVTEDLDTNSRTKPFFAENETSSSAADKESGTYLSTTQSRWGMKVSNGSKVTGKFEFDLDANVSGNNKNGASSLANGRIRQANISYKVSSNGTINFGKKWTVFMGALPNTVGFTRVNFFAGNSGFLLDGVDYTHNLGNTTLKVELANTGSDDNAQVSTPTSTLVVNHKMGNHMVGAAYTMASIDASKTDATNNKDSDAAGMKLYYSGKFGKLSAVAEYTMGENLGSIHTGFLGSASDTTDTKVEATGYFASLRYSLEKCSLYGGYGMNELDDSTQVASSGSTSGVSSNTLMTVGYDTMLDKNLKFFVEYNGFETDFTSGSTTTSTKAKLYELGMVFNF